MHAFSQASTTDANASLTSNSSIWSIVSPACLRTFSVAGIGPFSMVSGSTPTSVVATMRARGLRPSSFAFSGDASSTADAPSDTCDDEPAVWMPPGMTGFRVASFSSELSRRPSSLLTTRFSPVSLPSASSTGAVTGTISRSKRFSAHALIAFCWLSRPKRSVSSRVMPYSLAMRSAPSNCDVAS